MDDPLPRLQFDRFVLDEANASLSREGHPVALPPKAFALLCALARQPGKLARKDHLLDAVWGHRHVSESVLKTTISQVRTALDDNAGEPRYVETVPRHGYRFIGRIVSGADAPEAAAARTAVGVLPVVASGLPVMIGRTDALARLRAAWGRAQAGQRQLVWVEGDAGIGKTTLIDRLVAEVGAECSAHGQCVEQFGAGEPYLPLLDALEALARRTPELVPAMRQVAPTWLVQMPWLVADADRGALHAELAGAGQDRMVRELWELMERCTRDRPLLLVTEDLHWSDQGTLRLMDHFARRRGPMRLLWVASFRLLQVIAEQHPLQQLRQELRLHRLCDELLLDSFSEREVAEYVETRVPGRSVPVGFVRTLHAHTDGLPLFVANVLDAMLAPDAGLSAADDWSSVAERRLPVPDSLAGAIEKQLAKLPQRSREVLEAAGVCGMEFRAATVADMIELDVAAVADTCDELVRRQYWLREAGIVALPDGTIDAKYLFRHAVYRHVFYQRLASAQRIGFHRRAARALERGRAAGAPATSAEIASHHELGREFREAVVHYGAAAENALSHYAPQEALQLTDQALALLPNCPPGVERQELELSLSATRGSAFGLVHGIAARETIEAFERVSDLCDSLPPSPARALLLNSVGWGLLTRSEYAGAIAMVRRIHAVAAEFDDKLLFVFGCNLIGVTLANVGRFAEACRWMRDGIAVCEREGERLGLSRLYVDPQVSMCANIAPPLVQLSLADQARAMTAKALARSAQVGQPMGRLVAHWCACAVAVRLEDVEAADANAAKLEELVATTTIQQALGPARWFRGWVEIRRGRIAQGLALVRDGYALYAQVGTYAGCSETLSYAVEALVLEQRWDEAQATLAEANTLVERFGERLFVTDCCCCRHASRLDAATLQAPVLQWKRRCTKRAQPRHPAPRSRRWSRWPSATIDRRRTSTRCVRRMPA